MFWYLIAKFLAQPKIVNWLINRAMQTPYTHIRSQDCGTIYMYRFWLFNPYLATATKVALKEAGKKIPWQFPISIRLHRIMRADHDRDLHDHPWDARTIVLRGAYDEVREYYNSEAWGTNREGYLFTRSAGQTASLKFEEYHRILKVPKDGVWTLFITYKFQGVWGFKVNGKKIPYYEYLKGVEPE